MTAASGPTVAGRQAASYVVTAASGPTVAGRQPATL